MRTQPPESDRNRIRATWTTVMVCFFLISNLVGFVRPKGLLPFRYIGFPFTFAAWGSGVEEGIDILMLALNIAIALVVSIAVGWAIAWVRHRSAPE